MLDEYHGTLVTHTDLKQAIDKLSQRIEQVAEQVVHLEKNNNIRFEAMEKSNTARFEIIEKRFEQMQQNMNIRFEAMEKSNTARFEAIDKRFEQIQENMVVRFEAINKQFGMLRWFLGACLAAISILLVINIF